MQGAQICMRKAKNSQKYAIMREYMQKKREKEPYKRSIRRKTPPQKDNKKPILRISVEEPAENPQALLFAHVRKGRKQPVNCPRPRYLRSAAKNDLSIRVKPQPYMGKMRACGVPYALILAYASQKQLPKFGCS